MGVVCEGVCGVSERMHGEKHKQCNDIPSAIYLAYAS